METITTRRAEGACVCEGVAVAVGIGGGDCVAVSVAVAVRVAVAVEVGGSVAVARCVVVIVAVGKRKDNPGAEDVWQAGRMSNEKIRRNVLRRDAFMIMLY